MKLGLVRSLLHLCSFMLLLFRGLQGSEGQKTDTHKENEALVERILEEVRFIICYTSQY